MQRRSYLNHGLVFLLIAIVCAAALYRTDLGGRMAYALERGKLQADAEHLATIEAADIASLERLSHAFSTVAEVVRPSVVYVEARSPIVIPYDELRKLFRDHGMPLPENFEHGTPIPPKRGIGSGVILDTNGHIITNNHVVAGAEVIEVTLADGREYRADVIGADPMTDLAVIKINADRLHPARLGDSDRVKVGNLALAIGSPFRLGHSISHGIVSALGRTAAGVDIDYQNWIQTDASINPGNSGGPLINVRGEVIGINTAIATESGTHQGVGFAIPSNVVARVAEQLRTTGDFKRGYLGVVIKPVTPKWADAYGLDEPGGVFIDNVGAETPAASGGLKPEDIILAINGKRIKTREQLQELIAATEPGTEVDMTVWRNRAMRQLAVRIGPQPDGFSTTGSIQDLDRWRNDSDDDQKGIGGPAHTEAEGAATKDAESETEVVLEKLGFSADTVSPALRREYGLDRGIQNGALITRVSPTGEAFAADLWPGYVIVQANGRRIHNVGELERALTDDAIAKGIRLKVIKPGKEASYTVLRVR